MIKVRDTSVNMVFDSGVFKYISVNNPEMVYPNKLSKDKIRQIELSVAIIIDKIMLKS